MDTMFDGATPTPLRIGTETQRLWVAPSNSTFARTIAASGLRAPDYARVRQALPDWPLSFLDKFDLRDSLSGWGISNFTAWNDARDLLIAAVDDHRVIAADDGLILVAMREMRAKIARIALSFVDSAAWSNDAAVGVYAAGTNKCSLFVHDVLKQAGIDVGTPHGFRHPSPPNASDWANPNGFWDEGWTTFVIPHWRVLSGAEHSEAGDVVAESANYIDATGHVMFVGPAIADGPTFVGTSDAPGVNPAGSVKQIPAKADIVPVALRKGQEVFKRWDPRS